MTTNKTTDKNKVPQGTTMPPTPNSKPTIGTNKIKIIKSLVATCTKV